MTISLAFEALVSLLLIITIGYCFQLDRRLKALRSGQDGVRDSISQLLQATAQAEHSVQILTRTADQVTENLEAQIAEAQILERKLSKRSSSPARQISKPAQDGTNAFSANLMDRLKRAG